MGTLTSLQPPSVSSLASIRMISTIHLDDSPDSLILRGASESHPTKESMPLMEIELFYNVVQSTSSPMVLVRRCQPCQFFSTKMHSPPASLHPTVVVRPFSKWGIDFMHYNPASVGGHHYIIVVVDYFNKWVEAMPTFFQ